MTTYIQFRTENGDETVVLIEVDEDEVDSDRGTVKAGLSSVVGGTVAIAQKSFSSAIRNAVKNNAQELIEAVRSLPDSPTEVEITFGLKATGEVGNVAVCKMGAEANYAIKLVWKPSSNEKL